MDQVGSALDRAATLLAFGARTVATVTIATAAATTTRVIAVLAMLAMFAVLATLLAAVTTVRATFAALVMLATATAAMTATVLAVFARRGFGALRFIGRTAKQTLEPAEETAGFGRLGLGGTRSGCLFATFAL